MPMYYFNLKTHKGINLDPDGVELINDVKAREYGQEVAQELAQRCEAKTRFWRIEVCDVNRRPIAEVLFADIDPTIAAMPPAFRGAVEQVSASAAALIDTIFDTRNACRALRATFSRDEGKPYLASCDGSAVQAAESRKGDSRNK